MKLFIDIKNRRFVKSAASNVALDRLHLKRRDQVPLEIILVEAGAAVATPAGTEFSVGLKSAFSDSTFLAFAAPGQTTLDLFTEPVEAAFLSGKASIPAYLEVKWAAPGEALRTATLKVDLQNSVITGDEGTPAVMPDGKSTQAEAEAGTDNDKWMTPLRTKQAINVLAGQVDLLLENFDTEKLDSIAEAAASINTLTFDLAANAAAVSSEAEARAAADTQLSQDLATKSALDHTHTSEDITDFASAVVAVSPPVDWSSLTGKPSTFAPSAHTHLAAQITDLPAAVATLAPTPTTPANSGLAITGNSLATSYNSTIADGVVSVSVGGAPAAPASAWKAKNLVQVLDDILFPTILASVGSAKSLSLAVSGASGTLEIGSSHTRTLTAAFTLGTILDGTGSANPNPLVGAATGFTFTGTGISSTAQPGNTLSFTTAVVSGTNKWAVTAAHAAGAGDYFDNKSVAGTNLAAQRAAGSATDSTSAPTINGVHPYYYLKSASPISAAAMVAAIQAGAATKVIASSTGTLSIPYAPSAEYLAVAYPSTSTTKTRYFVTALDNGAITVVFAPVATQTVTTALWSQSYKIHTSTGALTNSNATIELRNT